MAIVEMIERVEGWPLVVQMGVISSVWLALGLACAELLFRRPARAHAVIVASALAGILTPIAMMLVRGQGWGLLSPVGAAPASVGAAPTGAIPEAQVASPGAWIWIMGFVWAGLSLVALVRLVRAHVGAHGVAVRATALTDASLGRVMKRARRATGIRREVRLLASREIDGPVLWAWGRPRWLGGHGASVILPVGSGLDGDEARLSVLRHEMAHLGRCDHWWRLVMDVLACALAWHPLMWLARRRARAMSERACDAWAIEGNGSARAAYAQLLVSLAPVRASGSAALAMGARGGALESRVRWVLEGSRSDPAAGRCWMLVLGALVISIGAGAALARHRALTEAELASIAPDFRSGIVPVDLRVEGEAIPVRFTPDELDLGTAPIGGMGVGSAWIVNTGDEAVTLDSIEATCGCTTIMGFEARTLAPGEWMELTVTMTAPADAGETKRKLVRLSAQGQPTIEMAIRVRGASRTDREVSASSVDWSSDDWAENEEACPDCGDRVGDRLGIRAGDRHSRARAG